VIDDICHDIGDIYDNESITADPKLESYPLDGGKELSEYIRFIRSNFTDDMIARLVATWFKFAKNGSHVMYPENSQQLWFYEISTSSYLEIFLGIVTVAQLILPFFEQPYCHYETLLASNRYFSSGYPSRLSITILAFVIINVQILLDPVLLSLSADPKKYIHNFGKIAVRMSFTSNLYA
jgi:hypothetical protein